MRKGRDLHRAPAPPAALGLAALPPENTQKNKLYAVLDNSGPACDKGVMRPAGGPLRENGWKSGWFLGARASRPRVARRWKTGRKCPCFPTISPSSGAAGSRTSPPQSRARKRERSPVGGPRFVAAARTVRSRHVPETPRGHGPDEAGPAQNTAALRGVALPFRPLFPLGHISSLCPLLPSASTFGAP